MIGIGASPGIAIGKAYVYKHQEIETNSQKILKENTQSELEALQQAIQKTKEQLQKIKKQTNLECGESQAQIFRAHLLILEDPEFIPPIQKKIILQQENAAYATKKIIDQFVHLCSSIDDPYLKERAIDIKDVGIRLIANILGIHNTDLLSISEDAIIIAKDLTPSDTAQMNKEKVLGVATDMGGRTSHSAIMARTLEIPAVLGLKNISSKVKNGDRLILDGVEGKVFINPAHSLLEKYQEKKKQYTNHTIELKTLKNLPTQTLDGHTVKIVGNIGSPEDIQGVIQNGGQGIGLYRTEFLYMNRDALPSEEEQFSAYREVVERMMEMPTIIRTLDVGGDKNLSYLDLPQEVNPFLGYRALRLCLKEQELFQSQLRAILRASVYGNTLIMYPFVSGVEEVRRANQILSQVKEELDAKAIPYDKDIKVGIMVEIPSAAITADIIAKEVDFFSIGTNDLCQYNIAIDRMNENINHLYQPLHPANLRLIKHVIDCSHKRGIFTGMCGEMAGDPINILILLGLGLDEFSMSAISLPEAKKIIRSVTMQQAKEMAHAALSLETPEAIRNMIEEKLKQFHIKIL